jgi:glycerate kinase
MRILIAPDSFTGTLSADAAARAMAEGWQRHRPEDELRIMAMSDGGPGFLDAIHVCLGGTRVAVTVSNPLGEEVTADYIQVGSTVYVELAEASGLHLLQESDRNPKLTSTFGTGQLIRSAVESGAKKIVVGLGGSATNDAGAGILAALGVRGWDADGNDISHVMANGGGGLQQLSKVDLEPAQRLLAGVDLVMATDVDSPLLGLRGATHTFGPQKGASTVDVLELELCIDHFAAICGKTVHGKNPAVALGAGAAGGAGFALLHLGASRVSGITSIIEMTGIASAASEVDLIITGEGSFDWQSLRGKVVTGISDVGLAVGVPVVVVAGRVDIGRREWQSIGVAGAYSMIEACGETASFTEPAECLARLTQRIARTWGR